MAELPITVPILNATRVFAYQQVAEKLARLRSLGRSLSAIGRALKVSDKTIAKALRTVARRSPEDPRAPRGQT